MPTNQRQYSVRLRTFSDSLREQLEEQDRRLADERARVQAAIKALPRRRGRTPRLAA